MGAAVLQHAGIPAGPGPARWGELADRLHALSVTSDEGRWAAMGDLIGDDVLSAFAVIGRPPDVGAELKRRYGDVADRAPCRARPVSRRTMSMTSAPAVREMPVTCPPRRSSGAWCP
ncbi:MAG TPA: hypothetical protein VH594_11900 [Trebonia sp.]